MAANEISISASVVLMFGGYSSVGLPFEEEKPRVIPGSIDDSVCVILIQHIIFIDSTRRAIWEEIKIE